MDNRLPSLHFSWHDYRPLTHHLHLHDASCTQKWQSCRKLQGFHNCCISGCTDLPGSDPRLLISTTKEELITGFARFAKLEASNQKCSEFSLRHLVTCTIYIPDLSVFQIFLLLDRFMLVRRQVFGHTKLWSQLNFITIVKRLHDPHKEIKALFSQHYQPAVMKLLDNAVIISCFQILLPNRLVTVSKHAVHSNLYDIYRNKICFSATRNSICNTFNFSNEFPSLKKKWK